MCRVEAVVVAASDVYARLCVGSLFEAYIMLFVLVVCSEVVLFIVKLNKFRIPNLLIDAHPLLLPCLSGVLLFTRLPPSSLLFS